MNSLLKIFSLLLQVTVLIIEIIPFWHFDTVDWATGRAYGRKKLDVGLLMVTF